MNPCFVEHYSKLPDPRIERNKLHELMDIIVLREDADRIRKGNAPSIITSIRHLVLNLFQKEPSKLSFPKKRRMAAWDGDFRAKVLFADKF
ncbi:hypothetical protein [Methylobacter svalbardensis]|uniref:hypothetical protein n=1 Tax=Methylobacter svalbardensis TaxID=3080016 RepID=UPI0030ECD302